MKKQSISLLSLLTLLCMAAFSSSCSTTSSIEEGEYLYLGVKKIDIQKVKGKQNPVAEEEVTAALSMPPNNAIFSSNSLRWPIQTGLWIHNRFSKYEKGPWHWVYSHFGKAPVTLAIVNPQVRAKTAANILHDYGHFRGAVEYDTIKVSKKKAKVSYTVHMGPAYVIDSIIYKSINLDIDTLFRNSQRDSYLKRGAVFSVIDLGDERLRLQDLLKNRGYYFFDGSFFDFEADTIHRGTGFVSLKISLKKGIPKNMLTRWVIGQRKVYLYNREDEELRDSTTYKDLTIYYNGRVHIRPAVLYSNFRLFQNRPYSKRANDRAIERLNQLNTFQYTEISYAPVDSAGKSKLDVKLNAIYDQRYDATLETNFTSKSNSQIGPGAAITFTKKNVFRGGESMSLKLSGNYEWQTKESASTADNSLLNSWQTAAALSLTYPRLLLNNQSSKDHRYANSTDITLSVTRMTRANYFRMLSFESSITYNYQSSRVVKHSFSPISLTFNVIRASTAKFDSIRAANKALALSLENRFIPAMRYTFTYDDTSIKRRRNHVWWQTNVVSAGNLTSLIYKAFGKSFEDKQNFFGCEFAQFVKLTSELRYNLKVSSSENVVFRFLAGAIQSYGNSTVAPYSEQLYIGGANSLRAFTVRSVGPGSYSPNIDNEYSYLDQTGELKMEANIEYRKHLFGSLNGAVFVDAGNIWLLREDQDRPGGTFALSRLGKDIALGTGIGLRYDLDFLVLRFDCGYALHAPYETGYSGYFNVPKFKDAVALHLAIGYPF
ncbi:MAG: BamA/TamA family outer membrane protein [Bacteroidaceae bacterium]|nr:BamA/TamA family outer membrane protein [Bacteroidaceae bacterium]